MARSRSRGRTAARGRRSTRRSRTGIVLVASVVVGLVTLDWLASRPAVLAAVAVAVLGCGLAAAALYLAWIASRRRREMALTRSIAVADALTGPEFEQWVAALLRRSGLPRVQVSGGAGDLGADIVALLPGGRRLVVQCKRHQVDRPVGSPDVQRFAGTARAVHEADVAAIVTTSGFTRPAETTAARLGIGLVDRDSLARWAADGSVPVALAQPPHAGIKAAPVAAGPRSRRHSAGG